MIFKHCVKNRKEERIVIAAYWDQLDVSNNQPHFPCLFLSLSLSLFFSFSLFFFCFSGAGPEILAHGYVTPFRSDFLPIRPETVANQTRISTSSTTATTGGGGGGGGGGAATTDPIMSWETTTTKLIIKTNRETKQNRVENGRKRIVIAADRGRLEVSNIDESGATILLRWAHGAMGVADVLLLF